jgi:hypothetical protein
MSKDEAICAQLEPHTVSGGETDGQTEKNVLPASARSTFKVVV